jgi:hypothetical protein
MQARLEWTLTSSQSFSIQGVRMSGSTSSAALQLTFRFLFGLEGHSASQGSPSNRFLLWQSHRTWTFLIHCWEEKDCIHSQPWTGLGRKQAVFWLSISLFHLWYILCFYSEQDISSPLSAAMFWEEICGLHHIIYVLTVQEHMNLGLHLQFVFNILPFFFRFLETERWFLRMVPVEE